MVNLETRALTYDATQALLLRQPDLRGIYVAGGGMEGAIAALREVKVPGSVALVVSALTPDSRTGLAEGVVTMVTDTPLEKLCRDLVEMMRLAVRDGVGPNGIQHFLQPDLHVAESI